MRGRMKHKGTGQARNIMAQVFKALRKRGYLARMNFSCCSSCAGYDLATRASEMTDKGKDIAGCAFWHKQDEAYYWETGQLALRYGHLGTAKHGDLGKPTKEQGEEIVALIAECSKSIEVDWDGNPASVIYVADSGYAERLAEDRKRAEERHKRVAARGLIYTN